jgi:alpha-amylase/alpha-mannosidase (GH57 family)
VEVEDSAAPYHDWNERICAECYAPNTAARTLDREGMVVGLINNYAHMSFNVGPTLLAWLQRHAPEVAHGIRDADRLSRRRCGGHGNALAQPYSHTILPLDRERDRATQVRWGLRVFRSFFGRDAEGMWLPETAVDTATLETLAGEGVCFTVLAPHQAARVRPPGARGWQDVTEIPDTRRPYLCRLPSGRAMALFFYDGVLSRGVAFEGLLNDGEGLYQRLLAGFHPSGDSPQLVHMATDGESYGHHHRFGEMALAYALHRALRDPEVRITNYGEFLALHPPAWEVLIRERTSWSCAHGIARWRDDCGCRVGGDPAWHQGWRAPLREALDGLKADLDRIFEQEGARLLRDPWTARDAYIDVILDRGPAVVRAFWETHRRPHAPEADLPRAMRLLEMQRHGLLMFTSCGWFFDDISGLEATQVLRYAARAIQLAEPFGAGLEGAFVQRLEAAKSNVPEIRDGRGVWERGVRPSAADLDRVVAHYAIRSLFRDWANAEELYAFHIHNLHEHVETLGTTQVALGRVQVISKVTREELDALFGVVHFGGLDFSCFQRPAAAPDEIHAIQARLVQAYQGRSVGEAYSLMRDEFPARIHHLKDLFVDEQRRIVQLVLSHRFQDYSNTLELLAEPDLAMLGQLAGLRFPIPETLVIAATVFVNRSIGQILDRLPEDGDELDRARELLERSLPWGYRPDRGLWGRSMQHRMEAALEDLAARRRAPENALQVCGRILEASERLEIPLNLWRTQNLFIRACQSGWESWAPQRKTAEALARRLRLRETLLPWNSPVGAPR